MVWTEYKDPFCGKDGPAPAGSVCVTVKGHNAGSGIQHLTIPANCLKPANPVGRNQPCLVVRGPKAGRILHIKQCRKKLQTVVTDEGDFSFADICAASEYIH